MARANPVQEFESLLSSSDFVFLVYFRGHWCPFCMSYLKTLEALTPKITEAGGKVVVVTAEPEVWLPASRKASGYTGPAITDPAHVLAGELKAQRLLDGAVTEKKGYEYGVAQPAILVIRSRGKGIEDRASKEEKPGLAGEVLFSWSIVPAMMNLGGAKGRPELEQVWDNVAAGLKGKPEVHERYQYTSVFGVLRKKIFG